MDLRALKQEVSHLLLKGKFPQAEGLLREAIRFQPTDAQLHIRLAEVLRRMQRNDDALAAYRDASRLLADDGHVVRAIAALKLALEIQPQNIDVVSELIQLELKKARRPPTAGWERPAPTPLETAIDYELKLQDDEPKQLALPAAPLIDPGVQVVRQENEVRYPLIRRLSDREFAVKSTPNGRWLLVTSTTPLNIRFVDSVEQDHIHWEG